MRKMKKNLLYLIVLLLAACTTGGGQKGATGFVTIQGHDLIQPNGEKLFIQGTNLGNWLNPEGYMFGFSRTNSAWMIDLLFKEAVGPDCTAEFWQQFKDNYVTRADIDFIASQGANTIRLPFNYKLFTDEDYMGQTGQKDGFERIDSVVSWCKANNLYLILDMHDCPGGQTGDNIDDGHGYPWLFESEKSQQLFCDIWRQIADRYKQETTILGYELMNEPIAHYFANKDSLYQLLQPLYKRCVSTIRKVDPNHIILLGGAHWNSFFWMLNDATYDDKLMYTCHRYGGPATKEAITHYINFRDSINRPMYMGEFGHNTMEWQSDFVKVLKANNIGYTFWPYKKVDESCMVGIRRPEGWDSIVLKYSETSRNTYSEWREARPHQATFRRLLQEFADNCRFERCLPQASYIESMGMD
jgi:aryl-phospho-beta-D-glucosidase BglC (GH1 family)